MSLFRLEPVGATDAGLLDALSAAALPTDDLSDPDRAFFILRDMDGHAVAYSGLEICGTDVLLRSMVVLPAYRGAGAGHILTQLTLAEAPRNADAYLATTDAAMFFQGLGFEVVDRANIPQAVLGTRQLSALCPASATVMKRIKPPA